MNNLVHIFDTTLRDGEQSPGATMNIPEKIQIALQLEKLGVDIIEAGFAAASPGDFESIRQISDILTRPTICSLSRALERDIEASARALEHAKKKRIHVFIATSPIHMEYKLKMTPAEVLKKAYDSVKFARASCPEIEFSCEDASRSELPFMLEVIDAAVSAGASIINIPDTVGYRLPHEIFHLISKVRERLKDEIIISVHCHNDLGHALANSLSALKAGARQVECTINGLGERAGNTALEELVMVLKTRSSEFDGLHCNVNTKEIYKTSKLVSDATGIIPQPNKAIVGKNAFMHESGIHQDGVLKHPGTYEIINPLDVGIIKSTNLVLGKHSGRAAFKDKISSLGYNLNDDEINASFARFKELGDSKKEIYEEDLLAIIGAETNMVPKVFSIEMLQVSSCSHTSYCSAVSIRRDGIMYSDSAIGNGTVDCILKAIDRISKIEGTFKDYKVSAITSGMDALANVSVKVEFGGTRVIGHGLDIDTLLATAKAYVDALNSYLNIKKIEEASELRDS